MTRTELKSFLADFSDKQGVAATLPVSVYQITGGKPTDSIRLYTKIYADERMLGGDYLYLKINDLRHNATVSVNGRAIGMPTAEEPYYTYDLAERLSLGENLLEISFEGEWEGLASAGIFGCVELLRFANQAIDTLVASAEREGDEVTVSVRISTLGSGEAVRAVATLVSGSGQIYYAGLTKGRGKITVKDPLLWWPRGMGIQNLYKLTVNLYGEGEIEDSCEMRIGFSHLTTDGGVCEVNGEPFVPLGAVFGLSASRSPEEEKKSIYAYMSALAASGANTLVIPEGTPRISDELYNLSDLYGIVVVHEISSVTSLIKSRLFYQGYRPSVGMIDLVGGGEDIERITDTLRAICGKTDVNHIGDGESCVSLASLPCDRTLDEAVPEGERQPFSLHLEPIKADIIDIISRASEQFPYAADIYELAYVSRLSAAYATERLLLSSRLSSSRALYATGVLSDGILSRGILDGRMRRTALYYNLTRAFAPTVLYAVGEGAVLDFYVMRSERGEANCTVEIRIADKFGEPYLLESSEVCALPTGVTKVFTKDFGENISGKEREVYLEYTLRDETGILSRRTHLFTEIRKFKFTKPTINAEIVGEEKKFSITLSSDTFTSGVELSFNADGIFLSDNCFDILAGERRKIFVTTTRSMTKEALYELLKIRTVNELSVR